MRFIKRRCFTLLELLIALGLTAMLLTVVTGFYQQVQFLDSKAEGDRNENFKIRYAETRLAKVLTNALSEYSSKRNFYFFTSKHLQGLTSPNNPSLVFVYHNGPSMNPDIANTALARLYVNNDNQLCLASWPAPNRWKSHLPDTAKTEILLDNVENLSFSFYVAPKRNRALIPKGNADPKGATGDATDEEKAAKKNDEKSDDTEATTVPTQKEEEDTAGEINAISLADKWVPEWAYEQLPPLMKVIVIRNSLNKEKKQTITFAFPLPDSQQLIVYEQ